MNKSLIEKLTALATELRARPDMTYEESHAAECALVATQHLEASDRKRAEAEKAAPAPVKKTEAK